MKSDLQGVLMNEYVWPYRIGPDWYEHTTSTLFRDKKSVVVLLPGAWTPI